MALSAFLLAVMIFVAACGGTDPTATSGTTGGGAATTAATTAAPGAGAATTRAATTAATTAAPGAGAATTRAATATTAAGGGTTTRATATTAPVGGGATARATATATRGTATAAPPVAGAATPTRGTATAARTATAGSAIAITGPFPGEANTLNGTGATFPAVLYSTWFDEYARITNVRVNYQPTGSSAGKNAIRDGTADFGGSDSPMSQQELDAARGRCGENILHVPTTLGAIVLAYNLPGNPKLRMDGELIADIFLGDVERWNDPRIAQQNPGVQLPNQEILTVHRSDGSGTTDNFTQYLSRVSQKWANGPRSGTTVNWPGGIGAQGNQGVAGEVRNNEFAIGYMELAFAKQSQLAYADVRNREGQYVTPNAQSVQAAGEAEAVALPADLRGYIVNAPGAQSYPITAVTWILVCPRQTDQAKAIALTRMLWWATHTGQQYNERLDYAPLPPSIVARGEQFIRQITVNGQPAFPGR